jgi:DNA-binding XRE family transcriptional regulator
MIRDGTRIQGEKHHCAKLTASQVLEIRARATESQYELAEEYGIGRQAIFKIITRRTWQHI